MIWFMEACGCGVGVGEKSEGFVIYFLGREWAGRDGGER